MLRANEARDTSRAQFIKAPRDLKVPEGLRLPVGQPVDTKSIRSWDCNADVTYHRWMDI